MQATRHLQEARGVAPPERGAPELLDTVDLCASLWQQSECLSTQLRIALDLLAYPKQRHRWWQGRAMYNRQTASTPLCKSPFCWPFALPYGALPFQVGDSTDKASSQSLGSLSQRLVSNIKRLLEVLLRAHVTMQVQEVRPATACRNCLTKTSMHFSPWYRLRNKPPTVSKRIALCFPEWAATSIA